MHIRLPFGSLRALAFVVKQLASRDDYPAVATLVVINIILLGLKRFSKLDFFILTVPIKQVLLALLRLQEQLLVRGFASGGQPLRRIRVSSPRATNTATSTIIVVIVVVAGQRNVNL